MSNTSSILSAPLVLWDLYVEYLWRYERGSWVEWIASCFRALAFVAVAPFAILTMLDVASYVIARTLGVVDVTKASTGGVAAGAQAQDAASTPASAQDSRSESETASLSISTPSYFKETVVEEADMKLSGADAFSPLPSQPPSPSLSRRDLGAQLQMQTILQPMTEIGGRRRSGTESSSTSRSGESQFVIIDRDANSEVEGAQIRKRTAQQGGAEDS